MTFLGACLRPRKSTGWGHGQGTVIQESEKWEFNRFQVFIAFSGRFMCGYNFQTIRIYKEKYFLIHLGHNFNFKADFSPNLGTQVPTPVKTG